MSIIERWNEYMQRATINASMVKLVHDTVNEIESLRKSAKYSADALARADNMIVELSQARKALVINLEWRRKREVLTDPQRRVYHGCMAKSEMQWTEWEVVEHDIDPEKIEHKIDFWRGLNDIACERGEHERAYFRVRIAE